MLTRTPGTTHVGAWLARTEPAPVFRAPAFACGPAHLPRIRERFHPAIAPADLALAHTRIREAATLLARAGRAEGAGDVAALGDLLVVAAATAPTVVRDQIRAAAVAFEQASRAPGTRTLHGAARAHFKASARALEHAPRTARGGGAPPCSPCWPRSSKPSRRPPPGTAHSTTTPRPGPPPRPPPCSAKPPPSPEHRHPPATPGPPGLCRAPHG
ncbi:hypothetical protein G3I55_09805 [Streptomyces sp. SID6648]|nr:hypothetical protein [Streptomyces sp. SID6648]